MNFYNEVDPFAAQWLRNLSDAGHIARGRVDDRSIADIEFFDIPSDKQVHFFAGVGVWSRALRLAGWPDDVPVWTGSCPCQPFSAAGRRGGFTDDRHLWPEWFRLIRQCRPSVIFGEQVASPDGLQWLDAVSTDLEGEGYAVAAADTCAAGVGAPHLRQRLYFLAYAAGQRHLGVNALLHRPGAGGRVSPHRIEVAGRGEPGGLADSADAGLERAAGAFVQEPELGLAGGGGAGELGNTDEAGPQRRVVGWHSPGERASRAAGLDDHWRADWIFCRDNKWRAVGPGTFPLAHGPADAVGRVRAYGNALVAPQAAQFVKAAMESLDLISMIGVG